MKNQRGNYKNEEEKRYKNILIRVSDKEKLAIEKNAEKAGLNISEYARQNLINGFVYSKRAEVEAVAEPTETQSNERRTIIGLSTNLNQLTKYVNSTHEIHTDLQECLRAITSIINKG